MLAYGTKGCRGLTRFADSLGGRRKHPPPIRLCSSSEGKGIAIEDTMDWLTEGTAPCCERRAKLVSLMTARRKSEVINGPGTNPITFWSNAAGSPSTRRFSVANAAPRIGNITVPVGRILAPNWSLSESSIQLAASLMTSSWPSAFMSEHLMYGYTPAARPWKRAGKARPVTA